MLDIDEIHTEIKKLEECECTTYDICRKLAILYIIRDHYPQKETIKMSMAPISSSPMMTP